MSNTPLYALSQANILGVVQEAPNSSTLLYYDDGAVISLNESAEEVCRKMNAGQSVGPGTIVQTIKNRDYILPLLASSCTSTEYQKIPYRAVVNFSSYQEFSDLPGPVLAICNDRREPVYEQTLTEKFTPGLLRKKVYKREDQIYVMNDNSAYPFTFSASAEDGRLPSYGDALLQAKTMVTEAQARGEYKGDSLKNSAATYALGRLRRSSEIVYGLKNDLQHNWRNHITSAESGAQNPLKIFVLKSMVWHRDRIEPQIKDKKIKPDDIHVIQQIENDANQRPWSFVETKDGKHGVCCLPVHSIGNSARDSNFILLQDPQMPVLTDKPPANSFKKMMARDAIDYALDPDTPSAIVDASSYRRGQPATVVKTVTYANAGSSVNSKRVVSYMAYDRTIAEVLNDPEGGTPVQQNLIDSWRGTIKPGAPRELSL